MAAITVDESQSRNKTLARVGRVPALDGLRAVAIFFVVIGHGTNTVGTLSRSALGRVLGELGHLGVDIFFVLSGFLITSLLVRESSRTGSVDLARFYWRRVRRIFPAYWFFLIIVGVLSVFRVVDVPLRVWLLNVFYLTDYGFSNVVWWTGHSWSLAIEEQFYVFWPLVIIILGIAGARRFAVACICLVPVLRLVTYFKVPAQRDYISVMLHTRMDVLMIGCLLAIAVADRKVPLRWTEGMAGIAAVVAAFGVLAVGAVVSALLGAAYKFSVGYTLSATAVAFILIFVLARPTSVLARILSFGPVVWLGRISYSLYLWQQPFLTPLNHTILGRSPFNVFVAAGIAALSFYFVECRFYRPKPYAGDLLLGDASALPVSNPQTPADARSFAPTP